MNVRSTDRDQMRDGLLDAMDRLLTRYGYQKTTVDDLAAEAGIGKGTIYLHFSSKEQVALSCIDRFHDRLLAKLHDIVSSNRPARGKIESFLKERVLSRFAYCKNTYSLDEMLAALHKELLARKARYHQEEAAILRDILERGAAEGELPSCDYEAVAEAMIVATNSLMPYSQRATQLGSCEQIEVRIEKLAAVLTYGIAGLPLAIQTAHSGAK